MSSNSWTDPGAVRKYISGRVLSEADLLVAHRLKELSPKILLELGTGPGLVARKASIPGNYIPSDVSMEFLKLLDLPASVCFTAHRIPLRDCSVDCILAMAVLHHLNNRDLQCALREVQRVLQPGGRFLLVEDWCFSRGETGFEEEARKNRFRYGTKENHLASGTWLLELQAAGFALCEKKWVTRPFHTSDPRLLRWPEEMRKIRMLFLEMEPVS